MLKVVGCSSFLLSFPENKREADSRLIWPACALCWEPQWIMDQLFTSLQWPCHDFEWQPLYNATSKSPKRTAEMSWYGLLHNTKNPNKWYVNSSLELQKLTKYYKLTMWRWSSLKIYQCGTTWNKNKLSTNMLHIVLFCKPPWAELSKKQILGYSTCENYVKVCKKLGCLGALSKSRTRVACEMTTIHKSIPKLTTRFMTKPLTLSPISGEISDPNCWSVVRKRFSLLSWRAPHAGGSWDTLLPTLVGETGPVGLGWMPFTTGEVEFDNDRTSATTGTGGFELGEDTDDPGGGWAAESDGESGILASLKSGKTMKRGPKGFIFGSCKFNLNQTGNFEQYFAQDRMSRGGLQWQVNDQWKK